MCSTSIARCSCHGVGEHLIALLVCSAINACQHMTVDYVRPGGNCPPLAQVAPRTPRAPIPAAVTASRPPSSPPRSRPLLDGPRRILQSKIASTPSSSPSRRRYSSSWPSPSPSGSPFLSRSRHTLISTASATPRAGPRRRQRPPDQHVDPLAPHADLALDHASSVHHPVQERHQDELRRRLLVVHTRRRSPHVAARTRRNRGAAGPRRGALRRPVALRLRVDRGLAELASTRRMISR